MNFSPVHVLQIRKFCLENTMYKNTTKVALKGIAMAMGIAILVMSTLKTLDVSAGITMLGLGLAALALASLQE